MKGEKALIISVGTGTKPDLSAQESLAHALLYSIKNQNPAKIFFVATRESQETTLPLVLRGIDKKEFETIHIDNPDDINKIYKALLPLFKKIMTEYKHVAVDYTSGTKAMTSALVALAALYEAETLSYVAGERSGGIVIKGTENLLVMNPYPIIFDKKFPLAVILFNRYQFDAALQCIKNLENLCSHPDLQEKLSPLKIATIAYDSWDKFQHECAFETLKKINDTRFDINKRFLAKLIKEPGKEPFYVADLINNAKRRAEESKYDDAVARLYRVIELIGQYKLKSFGIEDTGNVPFDKIPGSLKNNFKIEGSKIRIGLEMAYKFLAEYDDPLGRRYMEDKTIKYALLCRNSSILAHGLTPVSSQNYNRLLEVAMDFASSAIEGIHKLLQDSCFVKWGE